MEATQFRKKLIRLRACGKQNGDALVKSEISEMFALDNISKEQMEMIYSYLKEEGITIYDTNEELEASDNKFLANDKGIEDSKSEYFKMYMDDIDSMHILTGDERRKELEKIFADRSLAVTILPIVFIKDVIDISRLYEGQGVYREDLIGEGNVAVMLAAKMIDCCDSVEELEEFVTKMIMDSMEALSIEAGIFEGSSINVLDRINNLNDKAKELAKTLERKITVLEAAAEFDIPEDEIMDLIRLSGHNIKYIEEELGDSINEA